MRHFVRCSVVTNDVVGDVHIHARWWTWWRVSQLLYFPPQRRQCYEIPPHVWEEFMHVTTVEQAMALIRRGQAES